MDWATIMAEWLLDKVLKAQWLNVDRNQKMKWNPLFQSQMYSTEDMPKSDT